MAASGVKHWGVTGRLPRRKSGYRRNGCLRVNSCFRAIRGRAEDAATLFVRRGGRQSLVAARAGRLTRPSSDEPTTERAKPTPLGERCSKDCGYRQAYRRRLTEVAGKPRIAGFADCARLDASQSRHSSPDYRRDKVHHLDDASPISPSSSQPQKSTASKNDISLIRYRLSSLNGLP